MHAISFEPTDNWMPEKKLAQIYQEYKNQIDEIRSFPEMSDRQIARIIAWLYGGGTENAWRFFIARKVGAKKMPKEMAGLLAQLRKK